MSKEKLTGFWFITANNTAYLITAANREAANMKFATMHAGKKAVLSTPAVCCPHCHKFRAPIDRDAQQFTYADATPCDQATDAHKQNQVPAL